MSEIRVLFLLLATALASAPPADRAAADDRPQGGDGAAPVPGIPWGVPESTVPAGREDIWIRRVVTVPEIVRTGDPFTLEIHLGVGAGVTVHPPDTLSHLRGARPLWRSQGVGADGGEADGPNTNEPATAGPATTGAGLTGPEVTLAYRLQALRPGRLDLPPLRLRVEARDRRAGGGPEEDPARGGRWGTLALGSVAVSSVLPSEEEAVEPAPPLTLPPAGSTGAGGLALLGMLLSGGSALGAWSVGRARKAWGGLPSTPGDPSGPASMAPQEARKRLRRLLDEWRGESGDPAERFREVYALLRLVLLEGVGEGGASHTSAELLEAWGGLGAADLPLLARILEEGDRQRFGGSPLPSKEARAALASVRVWLERPHA